MASDPAEVAVAEDLGGGPAPVGRVVPGILSTIERARERARREAELAPPPEDQAELERRAEEARRRKAAGGFTRLCWPRFALDDPESRLPAEVLAWARDGVAAGGGLYLTGAVGTGKTQAAWDVIGALVIGGAVQAGDVEAWAVPDLLDALRPSDREDGRDLLAAVAVADLLLLDDLGAERASEWTMERLYVVLCRRYNHCRPTIVTSNLAPAAVAPYLGERLASRLAQMCRVVVFDGPDRRRAAGHGQ